MKYLVDVSSVTRGVVKETSFNMMSDLNWELLVTLGDARLDQVKIEERVELEVSSVWKNILGGVKKGKLDVEIEERTMYITKERC